jgi:hypothetical protein
MGRLPWLVVALTGISMVLSGCSPSGPPRKETFPVTGEVYVDGKPAEMLRVEMYDLKGMDTQMPTYSSAFTDKDGKFQISTYEQADGVPEGEYVVTYMWGDFDVFSREYKGPDKLKDKHSDPKTSAHRVKVEKGKPTEMGRIELKTE